MSASQAPRDAIAQQQLFVPIDATGADFYDLGRRFATPVAILSELGGPAQLPRPRQTGVWDPRCLRWHDLQRPVVGLGIPDRRLSVQIVNDYGAEYADARAGDAPFGQPELFTSANRSTREVDTQGRVTLPSSHRRILDSEDDRYALALTCRSVPLQGASTEAEAARAQAAALPQGVYFHERGSRGGVTFFGQAVSVGGATFFGGAAVRAAQAAIQAGRDAGVAASNAALGRTRARPLKDPDAPAPVAPDAIDPPSSPLPHSVPLLDHPAGYVWSRADRIGLLGTLVVPEGAAGHYFEGREGTRIGPLPWRHDAQVSMGPETVGRIVFVSDDAAQLSRGSGKRIKGEMWADSSRANKDTELGHETVQFRPVIAVDCDLPPSREPPPWWWEPPPEDDEEDEEEQGGKGNPKHPKPPQGKRRRPARGPAGQPAGKREWIRLGGLPGLYDLPPVRDPAGQARDLSRPGVPCPNLTAGVLLDGPPPPDSNVIRVPGGYVQFEGHPAVTPVPGGRLVVGGVEQRVREEPRPSGKVSERPVSPFGLPPVAGSPRRKRGGIVVTPPLGGDRGVPRGYGERYERAKRAWRRDQAELKRLRELEELEQRVRNAGRTRYADRIRRARERLQEKRQDRLDRRERLRRYKARKREEAAARQARRRERLARLKRERRERRKRRREQESPRRRTAPQGGYVIDLQDPDLDSLTPEQRRLLERDVARGWLDPSVLGLASERAPRSRPMGEWNVANAPLPFLGQVQSLEQWANVATYQLRALQRVLLGAFGGPDYLASNLAIVDRSGTGHVIGGCGPVPVLTVRTCGGVALRVEGDLVVSGEIRQEGGPQQDPEPQIPQPSEEPREDLN